MQKNKENARPCNCKVEHSLNLSNTECTGGLFLDRTAVHLQHKASSCLGDTGFQREIARLQVTIVTAYSILDFVHKAVPTPVPELSFQPDVVANELTNALTGKIDIGIGTDVPVDLGVPVEQIRNIFILRNLVNADRLQLELVHNVRIHHRGIGHDVQMCVYDGFLVLASTFLA